MKRALPLLMLFLLVACKREEPVADPAPPAAEAPAVATVPDAPAATPPAGQVPRAFLCRGNEPFWSLDIRADGALLKTPESETALDGELVAGAGGAFTFRGAPDGSPGDLVEALVSPAQCFDSMADGPASPFSAQVGLPGGQAGTGCCTAEFGLDLAAAAELDASKQPEGDWSRHWPDLADAIGTCVRDAGVATDVVTAAWPMNHGKGIVRLRDTGNARFDCLADLGDGSIENITPVADGDLQPGEGQPVFIPAREGPPVLGCGRVLRVMVGGDAVIGYLHYTDGCG